MFTFINILGIFFVLLLTYQLILSNKIIEGLENNTEYPNSVTNKLVNDVILSEQNTGNIKYIKPRTILDQDIYEQVKDLSINVLALQEQVKELVLTQKDYVNKMTGGMASDINGIEENVNITETVT